MFWTWAWEHGDAYGEAIPPPRVPKKRKQKPPQRLAPTWEELDAVVEQCDGWIRLCAIVMRYTGLRIDSQVLRIEWKDIDLERGFLHVTPEMGKSEQENSGRWIPLSHHLLEEIEGWGRRDGFLIQCPQKDRTLRSRDMAKAWVRSELPKTLWFRRPSHAFRAGVKSGMIAGGAPEKAANFLVGHAVDALDLAYLDPRALPLVRAVQSVPKIGSASTQQTGDSICSTSVEVVRRQWEEVAADYENRTHRTKPFDPSRPVLKTGACTSIAKPATGRVTRQP